MPDSAAFSDWSHEVAGGFLANALIVDDRARLATRKNEDKPTTLITPTRQGATPHHEEVPRNVKNGAHELYAKSLIDDFAKHGIICGVFCPSKTEIDSFAQDFSAVLERADVVILDWVLHEFKNGEKTLEIIKMLQDPSGNEKRRARLILVYSGESDLSQIVNSIRQNLSIENDGDPYTIRARSLRISVYAKDQTKVLKAHEGRCIKEENLPETVIGEFAAMAGGLVSNVALKSLAVLRANTHQLLSTFNRTLDAPYVTHRTLLLPEEASDHVVPLIVSEIQSILEDERVGELAGLTNVTNWFKYQVQRRDQVFRTTYRRKGVIQRNEPAIEEGDRGFCSH